MAPPRPTHLVRRYVVPRCYLGKDGPQLLPFRLLACLPACLPASNLERMRIAYAAQTCSMTLTSLCIVFVLVIVIVVVVVEILPSDVWGTDDGPDQSIVGVERTGALLLKVGRGPHSRAEAARAFSSHVAARTRLHLRRRRRAKLCRTRGFSCAKRMRDVTMPLVLEDCPGTTYGTTLKT
ncbi:hypothetical protein VDGL01_01475 [Verticillium dahliae]